MYIRARPMKTNPPRLISRSYSIWALSKKEKDHSLVISAKILFQLIFCRLHLIYDNKILLSERKGKHNGQRVGTRGSRSGLIFKKDSLLLSAYWLRLLYIVHAGKSRTAGSSMRLWMLHDAQPLISTPLVRISSLYCFNQG